MRIVLSLALLVAATAYPSYLPHENTTFVEKPRILVVNDDGIDSPGIAALAVALNSVGEVVVCAPDGNRSGASHSVSPAGEDLSLRPADMAGAIEAWSISGTPADATSFGILHLGAEDPFDLVVSGVNRGANVGLVAHYSGTVGAAVEGAIHGIPSIAVSLDHRSKDWALAAAFTAQLAKHLLEEGASPGVVYSVNVPKDASRGRVIIAPMGGLMYRVAGYSREEPDTDGNYTVKAKLTIVKDDEGENDTAAYFDGAIAVTPLRIDWTDTEALAALQDWKSD